MSRAPSDQSLVLAGASGAREAAGKSQETNKISLQEIFHKVAAISQSMQIAEMHISSQVVCIIHSRLVQGDLSTKTKKIKVHCFSGFAINEIFCFV